MKTITTPEAGRNLSEEVPYVIGVDPGMTGGIAVLSCTGQIIEAGRTPVLTVGKRKVVDGHALSNRFFGYLPGRAIVESVNAMPGQGVSSTFTFGRATGAVETWVLSMGWGIELVAAGKWKAFWKLGKRKQASLDRAATLWPAHASIWNVGANDGIAEAALIAEWYRRAVR